MVMQDIARGQQPFSHAVQPAQVATFAGPEGTFVADTCAPLRDAGASGQIGLWAYGRGTYPGQDEAVDVIIVPNLLVVHEGFDEQLAHDILSAIFEFKAELEAAHPAAIDLTLENAVQNSPLPYHPGAIRYYEEQGVTIATPAPAATPGA